MEIQINSAAMRPHIRARECLVDEQVHVHTQGARMRAIETDTSVKVEGLNKPGQFATVTCTSPGEHRLRVETIEAGARDLVLVAFEGDCLDVIPTKSTGRAAPKTDDDKRMVLRALANDPSARCHTGRATDLRSLPLAHFGA